MEELNKLLSIKWKGGVSDTEVSSNTNWSDYSIYDKYITDGTEIDSNSKRAPFHMTLMYMPGMTGKSRYTLHTSPYRDIVLSYQSSSQNSISSGGKLYRRRKTGKKKNKRVTKKSKKSMKSMKSMKSRKSKKSKKSKKSRK